MVELGGTTQPPQQAADGLGWLEVLGNYADAGMEIEIALRKQ